MFTFIIQTLHKAIRRRGAFFFYNTFSSSYNYYIKNTTTIIIIMSLHRFLGEDFEGASDGTKFIPAYFMLRRRIFGLFTRSFKLQSFFSDMLPPYHQLIIKVKKNIFF